ncbi:hypothetical protein R3W88_033214 [Solanum pinnatisectum]|uniref:Uncharacterized protein n=1 Tax=Solanum pinnatisectum TaxID=50273 RepID=A0AAV9K208_9SOLN|nr:hypothetical protein R3W88_033214 [Solanum pinnatisectum]
MAPKRTSTYAAKGKSKSFAPSRCLLIEEDTGDTEYIPPTTRTSPIAPHTTRNRAQLVILDVVTAFQSDEGDTQIGSLVGTESSSGSGSIFGSSSNGVNTSSFEGDSVGHLPVPPNTNPALVAEEPNRWYISGQYQIYRDARMLNEKDRMARLVTEERRGSHRQPLHRAPSMSSFRDIGTNGWPVAQGPSVRR